MAPALMLTYEIAKRVAKGHSQKSEFGHADESSVMMMSGTWAKIFPKIGPFEAAPQARFLRVSANFKAILKATLCTLVLH